MPKFYDVEQGSEQWGLLRMGKPTASDFHKILTTKGKLSAQANQYENRLIAEIMLMRPIRTIAPTYAMQHGTMKEPEARASYEFINSAKLVHAGFITDDDGYYGCSPDGKIVGANAGVEIKCPLSEEQHITCLIDNQYFIDEHKPQVQGQIFVAKFDYVDMISYHDDFPPVIVRVEPDPIFQENLAEALSKLRENMNRKIERLIEQGHLKLDGYTAAQKEVPNDVWAAG